jgi:hypothetical protein
MKTNCVMVTPKNQISLFVSAEDRAYFSKPVRVIPQYSTIVDRLVWVKDPKRGHTYPTNPDKLKFDWSLTKQQRAAMA